jgi:uncharacterized protein YjbJ (UPF0337 family)
MNRKTSNKRTPIKGKEDNASPEVQQKEEVNLVVGKQKSRAKRAG